MQGNHFTPKIWNLILPTNTMHNFIGYSWELVAFFLTENNPSLTIVFTSITLSYSWNDNHYTDRTYLFQKHGMIPEIFQRLKFKMADT